LIDSLFLIGKMVNEKGEGAIGTTVAMKRKEQYLAKVIFDLDEKQIKIDPVRYSQQLEEEYKWKGHTFSASREPVQRLTVSNIKYLTGGPKGEICIINIRKRIDRLNNNLKTQNIIELYEQLRLIEDTFYREGTEKVLQQIEQALQDAGLDERKIALYTVCIRRQGKIIELAKSNGYEEFLNIALENPESRQQAVVKGICHICGESGEVLTNPAFKSASLLKIYVIDKKGFMSGISQDSREWMKNFAICKSCRRYLNKGWEFIKQHMKTKNIDGITTYLIPRLEGQIPTESLVRWAGAIRAAYDAVSTYEGLMDFEKKLNEYSQIMSQDGLAWYSITAVFSKGGGGAHFSLLGVIRDVPVTRLDELRSKMLELERWSQSLLGGDQKNFDVGLNAIALIFPLRIDEKRVPRDPKPLLDLFNAILTGIRYPQRLLLERALLLARIHRFKSYEGTNIRDPGTIDQRDLSLCLGMLKYDILFIMMRDMGVLHVEMHQNESERLEEETNLPHEVMEWFSRAGYLGHQKALFLLGYLVAEIGRAQSRKGDKKKPVLDKINFYGMRREKVLELANSILRSFRDYRLLNETNEKIYGITKMLLDKYQRNIVDPIENAYFVLSGYAFRTYKIIVSEGKD